MPFFEAIRLAFAQIRVQKLKSFFTLLGVMIGVMFLIAVVSIVSGMGNYMKDELVGKLIALNSFELRQRPNLNIGDVNRRRAPCVASPVRASTRPTSRRWSRRSPPARCWAEYSENGVNGRGARTRRRVASPLTA